MVVTPKIILLIVAVVLFAIAAFVGWWYPGNRFNLVAAGLFFYAAKDMLN